MNRSDKGRRNELRVKKLLESRGYQVERRIRGRFTKDFFNLWDLIAIGPDHMILAQVKTNSKPEESYIQKLRDFPCPPSCSKFLYIVYDHRMLPDEFPL